MHTRIVKDKGIDISSKYYIGNFSEIYETLVEDYSQTWHVGSGPFAEYFYRYFYPFFKIDLYFFKLRMQAYFTIETKAM
jgi:hypothetical protein